MINIVAYYYNIPYLLFNFFHCRGNFCIMAIFLIIVGKILYNDYFLMYWFFFKYQYCLDKNKRNNTLTIQKITSLLHASLLIFFVLFYIYAIVLQSCIALYVLYPLCSINSFRQYKTIKNNIKQYNNNLIYFTLL